MEETLEEIRNSFTRFLDTHVEFWQKYNDLMSKYDGNEPWFRRLDDIYYKEAPQTVTKLILQLHLTDKYHLTFPVDNYNDIVSIFSALWSFDSDREEWRSALSEYNNDEEVQRLIGQMVSLSYEMVRSLNNIH